MSLSRSELGTIIGRNVSKLFPANSYQVREEITLSPWDLALHELLPDESMIRFL